MRTNMITCARKFLSIRVWPKPPDKDIGLVKSLSWIERIKIKYAYDELKHLKTGPTELRKFGLLVGGVFAALGIWFLVRGKAIGPWFVSPGVVLVLFGLVFPRGLKHVYIGWMSLAILLGFVVSNVILLLFFFLVITPVGLWPDCSARIFALKL
jgi:hypothetical protein